MVGGTVTLFSGASVCIADGGGDVVDPGHGLFVLGARLLSTYQLLVDGRRPLALGHSANAPDRGTFVARAGESLVVERHRLVDDGLRDELVIRNVGAEAAYVTAELLAGADFARPDAVRRDAPTDRSVPVSSTVDADGALVLTQKGGRLGTVVRVEASGREPHIVEPGHLGYEAIIPVAGEWRLLVTVEPLIDGAALEPHDHRREGGDRLARWRRALPQVHTDHAGLGMVVARCADDLGALRVFDPEVPERAVVAAGVPWELALHGRDALLTAWSTLLVDPDLAVGVLQTMARFQGEAEDPRTEEEPGRILHRLEFGGGRPTYGAVDTTPLFVMLLGEVRRWGLAPELVERLLPHADAALSWMAEYGDRDGDGWIEYRRATDKGELHQGWRTSATGVRYADGRLVQPPIALAEVQALWYAALVARSHFAREAGDDAGAASWRAQADDLRRRFHEAFWLEDRGYPALGLNSEKRPIDTLASHLGWCLWTGILDREAAASVAKHLVSGELFTGYGVRTLAASTVGSSPLGYHHGAVWPHDTAIAAAGLMRYGFVEESLRILGGLLDAAVCFDGRMPELFAGFDRTSLDFPVPFPNACAPSAWAAAAVLLGLRTVLRFDPWVPAGKVHVAPVLPEGVGYLRIDEIPLLGGRISVSVTGEDVDVTDVPPGIEVVRAPREALRTGS